MDRRFLWITYYNIGMEGASLWIWYKNKDGSWRSFGAAEDTLDESITVMEDFILKNNILVKGGVCEEL